LKPATATLHPLEVLPVCIEQKLIAAQKWYCILTKLC